MNIWEFNASFVKAKLWFSKHSSHFADISNSFRVAFRQDTDSKFNVCHFNAIVVEKFVEEAFYKFTEFNNQCEDFVFNPRSLKDLLSENIIKNLGHMSLLSKKTTSFIKLISCVSIYIYDLIILQVLHKKKQFLFRTSHKLFLKNNAPHDETLHKTHIFTLPMNVNSSNTGTLIKQQCCGPVRWSRPPQCRVLWTVSCLLLSQLTRGRNVWTIIVMQR